MGFAIQEVPVGPGGFVLAQYAPGASAPDAAATGPVAECDSLMTRRSGAVEFIQRAQACSRLPQLQEPSRRAQRDQLYGQELATLNNTIAAALLGDTSAHADLLAIYNRHYALQAPGEGYERDARRQLDYTAALDGYVSQLMLRGVKHYPSGQDSEIAFARAVRATLQPPASLRYDTQQRVLSWLVDAPPQLLQSFGTEPRLVPWLAALQNRYPRVPAVRSAWQNLSFSVSVAQNFGDTYRATLAALPADLRASFRGDVRAHLDRQLQNAGTPEMRERFPNGEAGIRARIAAMG